MEVLRLGFFLLVLGKHINSGCVLYSMISSQQLLHTLEGAQLLHTLEGASSSARV